jgi:hypothetical protein
VSVRNTAPTEDGTRAISASHSGDGHGDDPRNGAWITAHQHGRPDSPGPTAPLASASTGVDALTQPHIAAILSAQIPDVFNLGTVDRADVEPVQISPPGCPVRASPPPADAWASREATQ